MEYLIWLGVLVVVLIALVFYLKTKDNKVVSENPALCEANFGVGELESDRIVDEFIIEMEMLPAETFVETKELVEVKDKNVIARIDHLIPEFAKAGNAAMNAMGAAKANGEVVYRAIIPAGEKLIDSRGMKGAVRGFYRGADGIKGHANLVAVKGQKGVGAVANAAAAAMGVAAMVVGQYYMTQINAQLEVISDGISQIQNFQDNEYRSKVFSLVAHVKKIADFKAEIIENEELRITKIAELDSLERDCTQLLGQANLTIVNCAEKTNLDYVKYEKEVKRVYDWFMYQKSLLAFLNKISDLRYALHLGLVSRQQCIALFIDYTKQVSQTQKKLTAWHENVSRRLGIRIDKTQRKREGFDGFIHSIPGLFNHDFNFRKIDHRIVNMITQQTMGHDNINQVDTTELYSKDVQIIAMNGKIYYLPGEGSAEMH